VSNLQLTDIQFKTYELKHAQASDRSGKSWWQTNGLFIAHKKVFIFFLSNGLHYKHDFYVIISPKPYLSKDIFVLKKNCFIWMK
jgi:hypothetical protein